MSRTAVLILVVGLALVSGATAGKVVDFKRTAWWYKACPGGDFAATPDKCATCTCGVRPGLGGADCWQFPNSFCSCFQAKRERCDSVRRVLEYNPRTGTNVSVNRKLRELCPDGFKCRNTASGPWCCPRKAVAKPNRSWKAPNAAKLPSSCRRKSLPNWQKCDF